MALKPWLVTERSVAFSARLWQVERSTRGREGQRGGHEFHVIRIPDFVNVIPVTEAGEIVLVRQFRQAIEAPTIELPGGLVDEGERDPAAAGRREMIEETGYDAPRLVSLGTVQPNPALLANVCHVFAAPGARRVSEAHSTDTEEVETIVVPASRVDAMIASGEIANVLTIGCLRLWQLKNATAEAQRTQRRDQNQCS